MPRKLRLVDGELHFLSKETYGSQIKVEKFDRSYTGQGREEAPCESYKGEFPLRVHFHPMMPTSIAVREDIIPLPPHYGCS